jgi:cytochrome c oxidase assembly protein subunit 15
MRNKLLSYAVPVALFLSLLVVMLGAYTRLTDAGLGCPDWPGCYGRMVLPSAKNSLMVAQATYPQIPIESTKAWTEMIHRYAAGTLALLIFFISFSLLAMRMRQWIVPWQLSVVLVLLVIFQAVLGMWTVTLKLLPVVVMGHLLGGMLIVACLTRLLLQISSVHTEDSPQWRPWLGLAFVIVFFQIALGGWVSSNYAGISCIGFPTCNGFWLPELHFSEGFNLFSPLGANYQGGLLDQGVRVTIHYIHRVGALVTLVYLVFLSAFILFKSNFKNLRMIALTFCVLVFVQVFLGILNVVYLLPIEVAVAHNGVAALLLAALFSALHITGKGQKYVV